MVRTFAVYGRTLASKEKSAMQMKGAERGAKEM
jgi:hypothetical protein